MKKSINDIMKKEHLKMEELVNKFKNSDDETTKDSQYLFNQLSWVIKEQFFMEEKLIFSVYNLDVDINGNSELIDDHEEILSILNKIENKKLKNINEDLEKLANVLKTHSKIEEDIFYEKLDNLLSDEEKLEMITRAKEFLK